MMNPAGKCSCDNSEHEAHEELHRGCERWGGADTGKVLASYRMIKQADALLDPPSNEGTESYIVPQLPKRWTLSHAVSLLKEDACLLAPNEASDTTATGKAVRLLRVQDFGATCDVSVSRHGS